MLDLVTSIDRKQSKTIFDIEPTDEGLQKWREIVTVIFQYFNLILELKDEKLQSLLEDIWKPYDNELKSMNGSSCNDLECLQQTASIITSNMITQGPS